MTRKPEWKKISHERAYRGYKKVAAEKGWKLARASSFEQRLKALQGDGFLLWEAKELARGKINTPAVRSIRLDRKVLYQQAQESIDKRNIGWFNTYQKVIKQLYVNHGWVTKDALGVPASQLSIHDFVPQKAIREKQEGIVETGVPAPPTPATKSPTKKQQMKDSQDFYAMAKTTQQKKLGKAQREGLGKRGLES